MERAVISAISNGSSTQDFTHSGSWQPKVAIFQWSRANTSADTFQEHASVGYGFTDGTNQRAIATASEDNAARGDSARVQRDNCLIVTLNPSGTIETVDSVATFNSWLSNGIRVNWTDQPAANFYITCTLLGGSEITDVLVGTFMTTTGSGDVSYTSASFEGQYGMFLSGGTGTLNTPVAGGSMMLGMATGISGNVSQWVQSIHSVDNPVTMSTRQYYSHSKIFEIHTTATDGYATFSGFTSNGFTVNIGDTFSTSFPIFFLIIKGGAFTVGNATEIGSVTTQEITVNKEVGVVGIFGVDIGTADTVSNGCMWTSGVADNTNQYVDVFEDTNGTADSVVVSRHDTNQIYLNITANATATSSTLDDEADRYAIGSSSFTLNWTNIGQARPFRYCTFGTGLIHNEKTLTLRHAINAKYNKPLTLRHDIREQKAKTLTARYDIIGRLSKTLTLIHDIRQKNSKTLTTRYRIWKTTPVMTEIVRFRKDNSGTTNATQTINLAFTPVALILTSEGNSADNTVSSTFHHIEGFSDGTNQACMAITSVYNADTSSVASTHRNDSVFIKLNDTTPSNVDSRATVTFGTNSVTFTWVVNDTNDNLITLWAIGGAKITNAKVNTVTVGSAGTGVKNYTGLGWNPSGQGKSMIFNFTIGTASLNTSVSGAGYSTGYLFRDIANVNRQGNTSQFIQPSLGTSNCGRRFDSGYGLVIMSSAGGTNLTDAAMNSWITDGFSLNYSYNASASHYFSYLVIEGGTWDYHIPQAPASTGAVNQPLLNGVGGQPIRGICLYSHNHTSSSITAHATISRGFSDGMESSAISSYEEDNQPFTDNYRLNRKNGSIWLALNGSGNVIVDSRFVSFGTNSVNFYFDATVSNYFYLFVVVADPQKPSKTLTLRHDIRQQNNKTLTLRHDVREKKNKQTTLRFNIDQLNTVRTQVVRFQKNSSGTEGVTQDIPLNFTPKAILVFSDGNTLDNTVSAHFQMCYGFSDGTNHASMCLGSADNLGASLTGRTQRNDSVFVRLSPTAPNTTTVAYASCAFITNGVRFTWTLNDTDATYITIVAFGSEAITNAKVNTVDVGGSTGVVNYTGLGFDPSGGNKSILFLLGTTLSSVNINSTILSGVFGAAISSSKRFAIGFESENAQDPTDTWRVHYDNKCYHNWSVTGTNPSSADFSSWITNGFALNIGAAFGATEKMSYLVIDGGTWDLGKFISSGVNGNQDITVSVSSRQLRGLVTSSTEDVVNTINTYNTFTLGATDGTTNSLIGLIDEDAQTTSDSYRLNKSTSEIIRGVLGDGTQGSTATFTSFGADKFSINWSLVGIKDWSWIVVADGILHNAKQLTLKYNIYAKYNKPLTLRHDIRSQKTNTLTTRYDIRQLMSKTLTLRHDIMQKLEKTLTLLYNIETQLQHLEKTLTLRHDIREQKNTQVTLRYNIAEKIAKTLTLIYGIRQQESKTLALRHDIAEKINKQLTLLYNIAQKNEKTLTLIYNLNQRIESTLTLRYDILQKLDKELTLLYNILEKKESDLTIRYDIIGRVTKTLTLIYNIEVIGMQHFEKQLTLIYNIAEKKNKSFTFRYDLLQKLNKELTLLHNIVEQKSKQTTLRYDIREQKQKELTLRYDIISRLSKTLTLLYNIEVQGMQHMEKELTLLYNVMEKKSKQVTLRYNIFQRMQKQLTLRYDIIARMSKQLTVKYNILQKLDRTLSLIYGIRIRNEKDLTLRYDIIGRLQKTLTLIYNVESLLPHFVKTFTMRYDIREKKSQTLGLKYNILQKLSKTFKLRFRILPKGFVESDHAVMDNKQKDQFNKSDFTWNILDHLSKIKWSRKKGWYVEKP